jgi:hypothetical protein
MEDKENHLQDLKVKVEAKGYIKQETKVLGGL